MAAADVERSVDSASETAFNELDAVLPLKEEPTTALTAVVEKNSVFFFLWLSAASRLLLALIGCRPVQWGPEALWSVLSW